VSDVGEAAGSGVVLGLVVVFLLQQLGWVSLSDLWPGVVLYLVLGAVLGGIVGWLIGRQLSR
jgi:membrane protein YqaA with SNARE-associated domain